MEKRHERAGAFLSQSGGDVILNANHEIALAENCKGFFN
jgi:hypothetical protein